MNRTVTQVLADVDLVLFVIESGRYGPADEQVVAAARGRQGDPGGQQGRPPRGQGPHAALPPEDERGLPFAEIVPVSAEKGRNTAELLKAAEPYLPEGEPIFDADDITDRSERFLAAEFLREKLFRQLGEELPYGMTVEIEKFEAEAGLRRIHAAIIVDRDAHKAMVIGRAASASRRIATEARLEMEKLFDSKVFPKPGSRSRAAGPTTSARSRASATSNPLGRGTAVSARQRIDQQPGFVLHSYPYRETSLIVEVFSRDHGRLGLVAKGARRPMSQLRGVLMAFPAAPDRLERRWRDEDPRPRRMAGWPAAAPRPGAAVRLLPQRAADAPAAAGRSAPDPLPGPRRRPACAGGGESQEVILRRFELALLQELGYGLQLDADADGVPVREVRYAYIIERGAVPSTNTASTTRRWLPARCFLDMARGDFREPETLAGAKALMRRLIQHYLGGQVLQSRRVFHRTVCLSRRSVLIELGVNIDHVATLRQARRTWEPDPVWAAVEGSPRRRRRHHLCTCAKTAATSRTPMSASCVISPRSSSTSKWPPPTRWSASPARSGPKWRCSCPRAPRGDHRGAASTSSPRRCSLKDAVARLADRGIIVSVFIDAESPRWRPPRASAPRSARSTPALRPRLPCRRAATPRARRCWPRSPGSPTRGLRCAASACASTPATPSTTTTSSPLPALTGIRELHIGHSIISRSVFTGLREAVREMKRLMREGAERGLRP